MKKKIVISLAIFTAVFVLGGIYLIITIEKATSTLNNLIELHRVEILREQLLMNARKIQAGLALRHTRSDEELDSLTDNMVQLKQQANKCLQCHHDEVIVSELNGLNRQIYVYENLLNRFLTLGANASRMDSKANEAIVEGGRLVTRIHDMTLLTHDRLEKRTQATLIRINDMKAWIFILIALGPIVAIGIAIYLSQGLARPLSLLVQATRRLKGGDLSFRVQGLTNEFGEMAAAFNEMAAALYEQIHHMQRAEQMTIVGEMASGLVHEIRNPLAGIKGTMQIFHEEANITDEEREILSHAIEEVQRIELLMKNLLDFATPPKPQLLSVNLNDVLEATARASMPYSSLRTDSSKAIQIVKHFDPHLPLIMVDPLKMQQVFLNLIMNSLQAMPSGGTVTVTTFENVAAKEIHIEIADTGMGISNEIKEKIFQPFFTTKHKGTGLGLAISKQFIEMHGGTIVFEENPAGGTTFHIILPCTQV